MSNAQIMRPINSNWEIGLRELCKNVKPIIGESPTIVELGSYMGESSKIFAEEFPNSKIYCIDSWESGFDDLDTCSNVNYSFVENEFDKRCSNIKNITKIKGLSTSVSIECDLIYIDACHKYECVIDDLNHWTPLVKKIISGHDYCVNENDYIRHPHIKGVKKAVDEILGAPDMNFIDWSWFKKIN